MKFSCIQENLHQGLNIVSHIASKSAHLPILNNVLIKAREGGIELLATNLEIGVRVLIRGKVESTGDFTVPAQLLSNYVALLPHERIDVILEGHDLVFRSESSQTKIKGEPASEFPLIPEVGRTEKYTIEAKILSDALSRVIIAAAVDDSRPELHGAFLHFIGDKLIMAATDSYRLAEKSLSLQDSASAERKIILPLQTLQELARILQDGEGNVEVYSSENQILFVFGDIEFVSRVIEGQYPDYQPIIPKEFHTKVKIPTSEFVKVIKTASLFTKSGIHDIALDIKPKEKIMRISSVNNQLGENISSIPLAHAEGQDNAIVFNYRFLLDGLNAIKGDKVVLQITDGGSPGALLPDNASQFVYVIMPIKQ